MASCYLCRLRNGLFGASSGQNEMVYSVTFMLTLFFFRSITGLLVAQVKLLFAVSPGKADTDGHADLIHCTSVAFCALPAPVQAAGCTPEPGLAFVQVFKSFSSSPDGCFIAALQSKNVPALAEFRRHAWLAVQKPSCLPQTRANLPAL